MSTIYLVRHGQGSFGTDNYDLLSTLGREQVKALSAYFAETGERIDHIYSGSLMRQQETGELLAAGLPEPPPRTIEPAFDEYDSDAILRCYAASLSPQTLTQSGWPDLRRDRRRFQFFLEQAARAWVDAAIAADDMTPWSSFHGRIMKALRRIMEQEGRSKTLIVSTSGGVIGVIVAHVLGLANHVAIELNWAIHNASITRLYYNADKVTLSMFNALPHLDREGRRGLITYR
jgi:broad specificity phosphatase PhoE